VNEEQRSGQNHFGLQRNYPNPFNPATVVRYELPVVSDVRLLVYDLLGHEVRVLANERKSAGVHEVTFDASALASGVYIYRLQACPTDGPRAQTFVQSRKLLLLR
jgi:hypothetical protein